MIKHQESKLVTYLVAGYTNKEEFLKTIEECNRCRADILEIGIPSQNPYSDGDVIKLAHESANKEIIHSTEYFKAIREAFHKGIWIMGYYDDLIANAAYQPLLEAGVCDAMVIPDMDSEQLFLLKEEAQQYGVNVIGLINPDMSADEVDFVFNHFDIVYHQLYNGPTGSKNTGEEYMQNLQRALQHPEVTSFAGFGITTKEKAKQLIMQGFDGVVLGTQAIRKLNESRENMLAFLDEVADEMQR